jgi:hypothetical protein
MCANEVSRRREVSQSWNKRLCWGARVLAVFLAISASLRVASAEAEAPRTTIAVVEFDYLDTSGEARDQTAYHAERLAVLARSLRTDLEESKRFKVVLLTCTPEPCSLTESEPAELVAAARRAGARLLLFGGVHKQSTLVQWAKAQVLDVHTEKVLFDRLMSFRGDDERAWRQLEKYVIKDLLAQSWPVDD